MDMAMASENARFHTIQIILLTLFEIWTITSVV